MVPEVGPAFSEEDRGALLRLAHYAIEATLRRAPLEFGAQSASLTVLRGIFITLHIEGKLRGCVGQVAPRYRLYRAVAETAIGAAFNDPRFLPVTASEAPQLKIEISVLSPLQPCVPEAFEVGRHGVLISKGGNRGLLLPQVATEHGWDRIRFLQEACHKAGLALDAWKHDALIQTFTAEIITD